MNKSQLLDELKSLAILVSDSNDQEVQQSAIVIYGLMGALSAGGPFLDIFLIGVAEKVEEQLILIKSLTDT
jgi:mannitol/fructose-specific phosphotransferase system IIA component